MHGRCARGLACLKIFCRFRSNFFPCSSPSLLILVHSSAVLSQPLEKVPKMFDNARMSYLLLAAEATQQADVA